MIQDSGSKSKSLFDQLFICFHFRSWYFVCHNDQDSACFEQNQIYHWTADQTFSPDIEIISHLLRIHWKWT